MSGKVRLEDVSGEKPAVRNFSQPANTVETPVAEQKMKPSDAAFVDDLSNKAAIGILCAFGLAAFNGFIAVSALLAGAATSWPVALVALPFLLIAAVYAVLGFFMLKKSSTAALIAFGLYLANVVYGIWQMVEAGSASGLGLLINFALLGGFWAGFEGISAYHRRQKSIKDAPGGNDGVSAASVSKVFE